MVQILDCAFRRSKVFVISMSNKLVPLYTITVELTTLDLARGLWPEPSAINGPAANQAPEYGGSQPRHSHIHSVM